MRILWGGLLLVAACGPKHTAPAKDFTLHDELLVMTDGGLVSIDAATGAATPVSDVTAIRDATWAGRCVVFSHGEGTLSVSDPVTAKSWELDDSAGDVVVASGDGTRVAWDCTDDEGGAAICTTLVDNSVDVEIVASGGAPLGWRGDAIVFGDGHTVWSVSRKGGDPEVVATIESDAIQVAPGGQTFTYPADGGYQIVDSAGVATTVSVGGVCQFAGADHLLCAEGEQLRMVEWPNPATDLASASGLAEVLAAPTGDGVAYTDAAGALFVIRGDAPARKLTDGPVRAVLDWRP